MPILEYYGEFNKLISRIEASDKNGKSLDFAEAAEKMLELALACKAAGRKIMFIGNGGSAAIAGHAAVDFWKNAGIRAVTFNDAALLTCVSNDYGYEHVFEKPVEMFADKGDILVAISSSGRSPNIINGVAAAQRKECRVITLSGFAKDNPLRKMGDLNFYVPSGEYGHVELIHHSICHYVYDMLMERSKK